MNYGYIPSTVPTDAMLPIPATSLASLTTYHLRTYMLVRRCESFRMKSQLVLDDVSKPPRTSAKNKIMTVSQSNRTNRATNNHTSTH